MAGVLGLLPALAAGAAAPLRVVVAHRPPLVFVKDGPNGTTYTGMLIELLPRLLEQADIRRDYSIYTLPSGGGGTLLANGSWTGVMGELTRRRADLALFPLTLTRARNQYISATVAFMDTGFALLVRIVKLSRSYSFLLPFEARCLRTTWLLVFAALAAVILVASLLQSWTRRARYRALERRYGLEQTNVGGRRERVMQHGIQSIFTLIGQGSAPKAHSWGVKLLYLAWALFSVTMLFALFSVIMLSAYTANLTANLTVSRMGSTIQSLLDLKRSGQMFGVPFDSSVSRYFRDSNDGLATSLEVAMVEYKDSATAVSDLRRGGIGAYITDYPVVKGLAAEPPCELSVSAATFGPGQLVIGLQPNSSLHWALDAALLEMFETGTMSELHRTWFVEMSSCTGAEAASEGGADGLSVDNVSSVFVMLAAGFGVALLWAAAEVAYYRFVYHKVHTIKPSRTMKRAVQLLRARSLINKMDFDAIPKDLQRNPAFSGTLAAPAANGALAPSLAGSSLGSSSNAEFSAEHWAARISARLPPVAAQSPFASAALQGAGASGRIACAGGGGGDVEAGGAAGSGAGLMQIGEGPGRRRPSSSGGGGGGGGEAAGAADAGIGSMWLNRSGGGDPRDAT
ncbi:MAG: hypothetical protein J3K34DRAFT_519790 [Monoraphidium minutum]|nr:MAG: hypothetical protein J3K34DRAFT_519790 [Monoraphidium minutum]